MVAQRRVNTELIPHTTTTDVMYPTWDDLLGSPCPPPEITPALPPKRFSPHRPKQIAISHIADWDTPKPFCVYCGKPFSPKRISQIYCNPNQERQQQYKRKEALIVVLACHMEAWGWKAADMLTVARKMIEVEYARLMDAMRAMGYRYVEKRHEWICVEAKQA